MTLFANRFLTLDDQTTVSVAGHFDEQRRMRVDPDGTPVIAGTASLESMTTRGDPDPDNAPALGMLVTKADTDPDQGGHGGFVRVRNGGPLGPIKTSADADDDRRSLH
jgi:hypothetical protein